MNRPLTVIALSCIFIASGGIGFFYHLTDFFSHGAFRSENIWIELVRLTAIVGGIFLFLGHSWARWLAVVWIGFHVVLSAFNNAGAFIMHALILALYVYGLFFHRQTADFYHKTEG